VAQKISPADRSINGPFDVSELGLLTPYLDFGSLRVTPSQDVIIRADIEDLSKRVVSLTLETDGHRLQLQAFAATKTEGLWEPTITALQEGVNKQGGIAELVTGIFGPELRTKLSVEENGVKLMRESRFVGVDGPRWFLRGVMTGPEVYAQDRYLKLCNLFRSVAVNRGDTPMPPGELLPITLPTGNE
jgi:hypothetical protein